MKKIIHYNNKISLLIAIYISFLFAEKGFAQVQVGQTIDQSFFNQSPLFSASDMNDDGTIIVLADSNANAAAGVVKVFQLASGSWQILGGELETGNAGDLFGYTVSISGDGTILAVGATSAGTNDDGVVYLYEFDGVNWSLQATIDNVELPTNGPQNVEMGSSLELNQNGTALIIADVSANNSSGDSFAGEIKVFERTGSSWTQKGNAIYGNTTNVYLGRDVDINDTGDRIAVSSSFTNLVQVYSYNGSTWDQDGSDISGTAGTSFGISIKLDSDGDRIIIGAEGADVSFSNSGQLKIFEYIDPDGADPLNWYQLGQDINGPGLASLLGRSVDINDAGNVIAAGGHFDRTFAPANGVVQVFELNTNTWEQTQENIYGSTRTAWFGSFINLNSNGTRLLAVASRGATPYAKVYDLISGATNRFTAAVDNDWTNPSNWSEGAVPNSASDNIVVITSTSVEIPTGTSAEINNLTVESGASLTIGNDGGNIANLTINGNLTQRGTMTVENGGSLIVNGDNYGTTDLDGDLFPDAVLSYKRSLTTNNWYLVSSSFGGEVLEDLISNHSFATGTGSNIGIAYYDNNAPGWSYQNALSTGTISDAVGLSIKLQTADDLTFEGYLQSKDIPLSITVGTSNGFNLVGNPYPSYLPVNDLANATNNLFRANGTNGGNNDGNIVLEEDTFWLWDQALNSYTVVNLATSKFIAPGQGFFVKAAVGGGDFNFTKTMQSHQNADTFQRSTTNRPEITLFISDGSQSRYTNVFYIENTTTGFDNGYDSTMFGAADTSFEVYTHLVSDSNGSNYKIQSLPPQGYENMVIPVGVNAIAGTSVDFHADVTNLPSDLKLYLEDRAQNKFTLLGSANNSYQVNLTADQSGIGRFYLHTTSSVLSNGDVPNSVEEVSVYTIDDTTLRIVGVPNGKEFKVTLYNILGKQLYQQELKSSNVNDLTLSSVQTGIYIVHVTSESGSISKKIVLK